jgi:hypothetical protein
MVPPEYLDEFQPTIMVKNWQSVPLEAKRDDWIGEEIVEEGRFIPAAVLRAMRRGAQQDPNAVVQRMLKNWRDVFLINDEAHHAYGGKKTRKGEEPEFSKGARFSIASLRRHALASSPTFPQPRGTGPAQISRTGHSTNGSFRIFPFMTLSNQVWLRSSASLTRTSKAASILTFGISRHRP